ncbi:TetR/AcrR family transcriptional regulator [Nocardia farcinica]|uniref:TetR/AcrR family transcriptional regulator n=1 Tax=Nocardia farcinica TaxID=37329 RepID=UPI001892FD02|nr:TetR/AcrR family transcriptional regulator [Nocardia farcinica]MBF6295476.1 TetR/AcrR family transcriptional regulator [Nocardia farcinica]MBF6382093.1 TetR/AcrR family transcriptional regulator [Nocardia farcinica]
MTAGPRDRLIEGTIALVREQGVQGAGLAALLERTGTSRNSLYQHFPAGKSELVEVSTRVAAGRLSAYLERVTATGTPADWVTALVAWGKRLLESSDFTAGCPVVGAALAESEPGVQAAAADAFADWTGKLAAALAGTGIPADRARSLAGFAFSSVEGAIVLARASKSIRPLDEVAENLRALLAAETAGPGR